VQTYVFDLLRLLPVLQLNLSEKGKNKKKTIFAHFVNEFILEKECIFQIK